VHASALELLGAPTELLLLGQAHIVGELDEVRTWDLDAGKVRLAGPAQRMLDDPGASSGTDVGGLESMQAWDGFRLELGDSTVATGDSLGVDAQARLLHAEGDPTVLSTAGMLLRTNEFDYDLVTNTVRTGPGRLGPRPPVARAPLTDQPAAPRAERRP